jgi:ferredoxin-nitrite reductase
MSGDFTPEQKRYLEGFVAGVQARGGNGLLAPSPVSLAAAESRPVGPDAPHLIAQDETIKAGKKLADQEKWKREEHTFDAYPKLRGQAARDESPKPADNFRWRYYGLFYVAPAQDSYMCRLRIPNGILSHWQFAGVADLAEKFGGGYAHVTTRANLQFREVAPRNAIHVVEGVQDLGLTTRGSGADNIRNVTGDATAGIGPSELIDTRPYARAWHFHILNQRALYGLPRSSTSPLTAAARSRHSRTPMTLASKLWRSKMAPVSHPASGLSSLSAALPVTVISRARPASSFRRARPLKSPTRSCVSSSPREIAPIAPRRG